MVTNGGCARPTSQQRPSASLLVRCPRSRGDAIAMVVADASPPSRNRDSAKGVSSTPTLIQVAERPREWADRSRRPTTRTRSDAWARDSSSIMPWRAHSHSSRNQEIGHLLPVRPLVELPDAVGADLAGGGQDPKEIPDARLVRARQQGEPHPPRTPGARAYQRPVIDLPWRTRGRPHRSPRRATPLASLRPRRSRQRTAGCRPAARH